MISMSRRPIPRDRRTSEHGFTLIELLVVIVILGILAGVVVFAVRGTGDKGNQAAIDTERRIIRTAQEAHCARFGRYAKDFAELKAKKLLSNDPGYSSMAFSDQGGPCNGTRYDLGSPNELGGPSSVCGQRGGWCDAPDPVGRVYNSQMPPNLMVPLDSGKVLAVAYPSPLESLTDGIRTEIYDPEADDWALGPPAPADTDAISWVKIEGEAARCQPNCGKVLALMGGSLSPGSGGAPLTPGQWRLYDPAIPPVGAWVDVPGIHRARAPYSMAAPVQITGTDAQCGIHCGKVLVLSQLPPKQGPTSETAPGIAELYDPKTNTFMDVSEPYVSPGQWLSNPTMTALGDGRVLVVAAECAPRTTSPDRCVEVAKIFDPLQSATGGFSEAAQPRLRNHQGKDNPMVLLPGGKVLAMGTWGENNRDRSEIFDPTSGTSGSWTEIASCSGPDRPCSILAQLPDGRVLAVSGWRLEGREAFLFDPRAGDSDNPFGRWKQTGSMLNTYSGNWGVVLGSGACGAHCNQVLVAGGDPFTFRGSAEFYTP